MEAKKQNKKIWFSRKRYGWGWGLPASWEGWVVLFVYIFLFTWIIQSMDSVQASQSDTLIFAFRAIVLSLTLIAICYWKGEKPKWSWGEDK